MLRWVVRFLVVVVITGVLSLSEISAGPANIAQNLCALSMVLFLFTAVAYALRGKAQPFNGDSL
jgi:uncharacterized membrane protein YtjA (UPF0391 family)